MTSEYQQPLFDRYDLTVEFEWKRKLAENTLRNALRRGDAAEAAVEHAWSVGEIDPLKLDYERAESSTKPDGYICETREPVFCFTTRFRFLGDEQLWHMNPGCSLPPLDGEIFRYQLIIAILATTETEAERFLAEDLDKIRGAIAQQTRRIREFNEGLPRYLEAHAKANKFFKDLLGNESAPEAP